MGVFWRHNWPFCYLLGRGNVHLKHSYNCTGILWPHKFSENQHQTHPEQMTNRFHTDWKYLWGHKNRKAVLPRQMQQNEQVCWDIAVGVHTPSSPKKRSNLSNGVGGSCLYREFDRHDLDRFAKVSKVLIFGRCRSYLLPLWNQPLTWNTCS